MTVKISSVLRPLVRPLRMLLRDSARASSKRMGSRGAMKRTRCQVSGFTPYPHSMEVFSSSHNQPTSKPRCPARLFCRVSRHGKAEDEPRSMRCVCVEAEVTGRSVASGKRSAIISRSEVRMAGQSSRQPCRYCWFAAVERLADTRCPSTQRGVINTPLMSWVGMDASLSTRCCCDCTIATTFWTNASLRLLNSDPRWPLLRVLLRPMPVGTGCSGTRVTRVAVSIGGKSCCGNNDASLS